MQVVKKSGLEGLGNKRSLLVTVRRKLSRRDDFSRTPCPPRGLGRGCPAADRSDAAQCAGE